MQSYSVADIQAYCIFLFVTYFIIFLSLSKCMRLLVLDIQESYSNRFTCSRSQSNMCYSVSVPYSNRSFLTRFKSLFTHIVIMMNFSLLPNRPDSDCHLHSVIHSQFIHFLFIKKNIRRRSLIHLQTISFNFACHFTDINIYQCDNK